MEGSCALDPPQVIGKLKDQIAAFKVPKRVWQVPELPRNAIGKVRKNVLREKYAQTFEK